MNLGAEPKKLAILGALLVLAVVVLYINSSPDLPEEARRSGSAGTTPAASSGAAAPQPVSQRQANRTAGRTLREFRPSLKPPRPEDRPDPMTIDPTLRLDVLAKLQNVSVDGSHRSIFEFGQPPAPKPVEVAAADKPPVPSPVVEKPPEEPAKPAAPPPPPIPFKFFGYVSPANQAVKRAFFLEGEDIHV
ncbi:MAG: hypothetical protein ACRD7E_02670, partial [Bryobacteraceae bacterium]